MLVGNDPMWISLFLLFYYYFETCLPLTFDTILYWNFSASKLYRIKITHDINEMHLF